MFEIVRMCVKGCGKPRIRLFQTGEERDTCQCANFVWPTPQIVHTCCFCRVNSWSGAACCQCNQAQTPSPVGQIWYSTSDSTSPTSMTMRLNTTATNAGSTVAGAWTVRDY